MQNLLRQTLETHRSDTAAYTAVDLCIMGGGAVASVAMLLARAQGLNAVQILPQATPLSAQSVPAVPRTYAIAPKVQTGLSSVGVWDLLPASQVQRCTDMRVFWQNDDAGSGNIGETTEPIHLSAAQSDVPQLCSFVSEADLLNVLHTAMTATGAAKVQRFYTHEQPPQLSHTAQGIRITQSGHAPLLAKLCLIAEGAASRSAAQLDLAPTVYDYGHSAVVAVLHSDTPCDATAWQWLGGKALGSDVLALLPLPQDLSQESLSTQTNTNSNTNAPPCAARYGLVWSQPSAHAQRWCNDTTAARDALLGAVQARCQAQLANIGTLSLHSAVQHFPLIRSTAPSLTAAHVVVLGDTAHKIHPLAGQGLNLGFEDVFTLFDVLAQRESWRNIGDSRVLARYQRRRQAHAAVMDGAVHRIANRAHWHSVASGTAQQLLRLHNDFPAVGVWFKGKLVQAMVR